jgi:hypothetical protein
MTDDPFALIPRSLAAYAGALPTVTVHCLRCGREVKSEQIRPLCFPCQRAADRGHA